MAEEQTKGLPSTNPINTVGVTRTGPQADGRTDEQMDSFFTQVTVFNVGKHATTAQFEKILKANNVEYKRAKKTPATTHGVLTFEVRGACYLLPHSVLSPPLTARPRAH